MEARSIHISRRAAIVATARVLVSAAGVAMIVPLQVYAKAAKADFFYQDKPKEGKTCATCRLFFAAEAGKGTCAVVEGDISATGWCMAHSPRS
ncbi:MAG TPA: high-potential iron-sulfur protein [Caldimonas sp.]|jgi:hypothetical protein|nr:high-potential iron-sulfur protein [Caldimonas sp.]HEV7577997.1 high-potential iron-sulfur protein [Caldimonas sp.]